MRVLRDFDEVYATQSDPWGIGQADSERYDLYHRTTLLHARTRGRLLDVGCGYGAFLARFRGEFEELHGVEVAAQAVDGGRARYPFIEFRQGSAGRLDEAFPEGTSPFDCIVYSDVINYLSEPEKHSSLGWIARHVAPDGLAVVAAWSPGGRYLTPPELRRLIARHLVIEHEEVLESGHALYVTRPRRRLVALTVDYETWQPVPAGRRIDWESDVFRPTNELLAAAERSGAKLTLMAELGEYQWLRDHEPDHARRMEDQWTRALTAGHDVQVHLHPNWLPELGARRLGEHWAWDWSHALLDKYPGNLDALIARCRGALESTLRRADPGYDAVCFRAGGYDAQPFLRLGAALRAGGIRCDSSVYAGPRREDRHHDYTLAQHAHQPWYASAFDPQLLAPPAERHLIELPIFAVAFGRRWTFDGSEGAQFADAWLSRQQVDDPVSSWVYRHRERVRVGLRHALSFAPTLARAAPRPLARFAAAEPHDNRHGHEYFVLVGHSKGDLDVAEIEAGLARLGAAGAEFVTLSEMLEVAERDTAVTEPDRRAVAPQAPDAVSARLEQSTPITVRRVLELAHRPSPHWVAYPWVESEAAYAADRSNHYDCVWADRTLERADDPQALLISAFRALVDGGVLMAAIHSDARVPAEASPDHPWRTLPQDIRSRLGAAGFSNIDTWEVDLLRTTGRAHPPAADRVTLVRAWKRVQPLSERPRIDALARWCYDALDPREPSNSENALEILAGGHAWCSGSAIVLGSALRREGWDVRWITMVAENHPRGRGSQQTESHEVLGVRLADGTCCVVDPSSAIRFDTSIENLLAEPHLADTPREEDARYRERRYDLYSTSFWYRRVIRVAIRSDLREPQRYIAAGELRPHSAAARHAWEATPTFQRILQAVWQYRLAPSLRRFASTR